MPLTTQAPSDTLERDSYLLYSDQDLAGIVEDAVGHAALLGYPQANAYAMEQAGVTMVVREGRAETSQRNAGQGLTIQVFRDGHTGTASTADFARGSVRTAVERAIAIAGIVEGDLEAAPADAEWLDRSDRAIPLFAPSHLSPAELADSAMAIENEVLRLAPGQGTRLLNAGAASTDMGWARAIGADFVRSGNSSMQNRWCSLIAQEGERMYQDYWSSADRRTAHLETPTQIAERALMRTRRKIGATGLQTRTCPILLDAAIAGSFVGELSQALMGSAQDQKTSFLLDTLGKASAAEHIDLIEDPFEAYGLASGTHDGEGVASRQRHILRGGVVEGYFLSSRTARRLGLAPTGNAGGTWNLSLNSRLTEQADDTDAMLRKMDRGLWVTEILGGGVNPVTGAYSKAVAGIWVENGMPVYPVQDITIAGEFTQMLATIRGIGADVHRGGSIRTGSILLDDMRIAGR